MKHQKRLYFFWVLSVFLCTNSYSQTIQMTDNVFLNVNKYYFTIYTSKKDSFLLLLKDKEQLFLHDSSHFVVKFEDENDLFGGGTYGDNVTLTYYTQKQDIKTLIYMYKGIQSVVRVDYLNGKKHGYVNSWRNGAMMVKKEYKMGVESGEWVTWYRNGNMRTKGNYDFEIPRSELYEKIYECCICLDDYGEEIINCELENCLSFSTESDHCFFIKPKHGEWEYYNFNGQLIKTVYYDMGNITRTKLYD